MRRTMGGLHRLVMLLLILVLLGLIAYLGVIGMLVWKEHHIPPAEEYDAIVVLGAQVKPDGAPSVQLQWRLDAAYDAWEKRNVPVVVCGAQGGDEPAPEAYVMRDYLLAKGVPSNQVLTDAESFNTRQNIRHAARLLADTGARKVLIVTSDYHLPRAMALAADEGLDATGLGSATKPEYWLKNHVREALSWIKYGAQKYLRLPLE